MAELVSCKLALQKTADANPKERKYTRQYIVLFDGVGSEVDASAAPGLNFGDAHPDHAAARLSNLTAQSASEDGSKFIVTVTYSTLQSDTNNPLSEPLDIQWSYVQFETAVTRDISNRPIVNSAGLPFASPIVKDDSRPVLTITRNQALFIPAAYAGYKDTVNSDSFLGAPPKTVKFSPPQARIVRDNIWGDYWTVTLIFQYNPDKWTKRVLDAGTCELVDGALKNIVIQGVPTTEPVLLNGSGQMLTNPDGAYFHKFDIYPALPFSPLLA